MKLFAAILAVGALLPASLVASQFGTGFAISPKGYLVTCHHVVRNAERVFVHSSDGVLPARIVALDPANDLAVLKVEQWKGRFLGLASAGEVGYATEVTAAGFPDPTVLGMNPKISKGIVNALSGVRDDPRFLQISAPVQPGNSGGPLLSPSGRVVGVIAAGLDSMDRMTQGGYLPQSVNYAVKTDFLFPLLENASIPVPKFGTRTQGHVKQVSRAIEAIALVEGLRRGEAGGTLRLASSPRPVLRPAPSAARGPWVFPHSHARPLAVGEVQSLSREGLWRARNEIYLRRGFAFHSPQGRRFASEFGSHYQPRTPSIEAVQRSLTPVEIANLRLIADYEARTGG